LIFTSHGTIGSKGSGEQKSLNYYGLPFKSNSFQQKQTSNQGILTKKPTNAVNNEVRPVPSLF